MERRTFVTGAGIGLAGALAGCLDGSGPASAPGDGEPQGSDESALRIDLADEPLGDEGPYGELTVELVDPRIEPDSPATIEATLTVTADETVSVTSGAPWPFGVVWLHPMDGEDHPATDAALTLWSDAYEDDHHVGTDGKHVEGADDIALVEDLESGASVSRTFELHAETPHLETGAYEGEIGATVGPDEGDDGDLLAADLAITVVDGEADGDGETDVETVVEEPRVDEPPYRIDRPEPPDDPGDDEEWNDHYLGEHMDEEPSLEFDPVGWVRLDDPALSPLDDTGQYAVRTVESVDELDTAVDLETTDAESRDRLESIDFAEELVVIVESGYGSGSVGHRWRRVEDVEDGVHLHGYYTQPYVRTDDYTARHSVVVVDRPDGDVELARVSLTVDEDRRIHFNSTEGPVSVEG